MTLAEFIDLLGQSKSIEGRSWVEQFKQEIDKKWWEKVKDSILGKDLVLCVGIIFAILIRIRIRSICTEKLFSFIIEQGHAFLREIHQKAISQGIEIKENEIDSFLTYTEMMAATGLIKVENNKVTLTEKGEEAAESVAQEIEEAKMRQTNNQNQPE